MCGIAGKVSNGTTALPNVLDMMDRLKNRGYDGAGVSVMSKDGTIQTVKKGGRMEHLIKELEGKNLEGSVAIGHTRWGTHGEVSDENAHPHHSCDNLISLVHNGQILNHGELRETLIQQGYTFSSVVDTEVLANLISREYKRKKAEGLKRYVLEQAVASAIPYLKTREFAIVVLSPESPHELVIARRNRPIVLGIKNGEYYVASERLALVGKVDTVLDHVDNTVATISCEGGVHVDGVSPEAIEALWEQIGIEPEVKTKGAFDTFLEYEIYDQPRALSSGIEGRINPDTLEVRLGMFEGEVGNRMRTIKRILLVACGTSYYAAQTAAYYFKLSAGIPAEAVLASEFSDELSLVDSDSAVVGISQSGETADTIAALKAAKSRGALTLGLTNAPGSVISRLVDAGAYMKAGIETSVASTKAFTSQSTILLLMALETKVIRGGIYSDYDKALLRSILTLPSTMEHVLTLRSYIEPLARELAEDINARKPSGSPLFIGAGCAVPWTHEAALKFMELNYVCALAKPASELKHGYIALVEKDVKVFAVVFPDGSEDRVLSNCEQVRSKGGTVILLDATGSDRAKRVAHTLIPMPNIPSALIPIVCAPLVQFLSFITAKMLGHENQEIDEPRNLAKSVTVE